MHFNVPATPGKEDARVLLRHALELRLRVRVQLHVIGPAEFKLTEFSFLDLETGHSETVRLEQA